MFRKVLRQSTLSYAQQASRHSQLAQYLSLREALAPEASAQTQKLVAEIQKKYNLSSQEFQELVKILTVDMNVYRQNYDYATFNLENQNVQSKYRRSLLYNSNLTFNDTLRQSQQQYPDIVKFLSSPSQARKDALKDLQQIFLSEQADPANLQERAYSQKFQLAYDKKIKQHVQELRKKYEKSPQIVDQIEETLNKLLNKYSVDPQIQNGRIVSYIQILNNLFSGKQISVQQKEKTKAVEDQSFDLQLEKKLNKDQLAEVYNIDQRDRQLLADESTQNSLASRKYFVMPWVDNKRIIFEAEYHYSKYLLLGAAAGGLGLLLLSNVYYGDAHYSSLALVSALTLATGFLTKRNLAKNQLNYLTQINLHKDGKHIDLLVQNGTGLSSIEAVPISQFKLFKNNQQVQLAGQQQSLNHFRQTSFLANDAYYAEVNGQTIFVPFEHEGYRAILQKVFAGQNVDTSSL